MYLILLNLFSFEYIQINKIYIEQSNTKPWSNKYINNIGEKFFAKLINNNTCQIDILNSQMINNFIKNIEEPNTKYYTIIEQANMCSKPEKISGIILHNIFIKTTLFAISSLFSFIIVNIFYEIKEYIKNNNIKKSEKNDDIKESEKIICTDFEKNINWLEFV